MNTELNFCVVNYARQSPVGGEAFVPDKSIYGALWHIAARYWGKTGPQRDQILPHVSSGDPHIGEFFALLKEAGWEPFYGEFVPHHIIDSRFWVRRLRRFEKSDRENVGYLRLGHWGSWEPTFTAGRAEENSFRVNVAGAKWGNRVGHVRGVRSPFFLNDDFKSALEAENLLGLIFLPVLWDHPEKAKGKFWQISSHITMPPCLLPVLNMPEDRQPWTTYDDGGHSPQELVFRRSKVEAIEPFDVALTSPEEAIHCGPNSWTQNVIVSQRFRQALKKLKVTNADLVPIRLVSDDWQRPLSDHDRLLASDGV